MGGRRVGAGFFSFLFFGSGFQATSHRPPQLEIGVSSGPHCSLDKAIMDPQPTPQQLEMDALRKSYQVCASVFVSVFVCV
jgi:hypothetical protein